MLLLLSSSDDHRGVLLVRGLSLLHVQQLSGDLDGSTVNDATLFATKSVLLLLCRWIEAEEILILVVIYYVLCTVAFLCTHTFAN